MSALRIAGLSLLLLCVAGRAEATVDFLDQQVTVDLVKDPTQLSIKATVKVAVVSSTSSLSLLATLVPLVSLSWNGTPLTVKKSGVYLTASLPAPAEAGTEGTLTAELAGPLSCNDGGYAICLRTEALTWVMPLGSTGAWYLVNLDGTDLDPHTGAIELLLPAAHRALALGIPPAVTSLPDGAVRWRFAITHPTVMLNFIAGALVELKSTGGFPTTGLCVDDAATRQSLQAAIDEGSRLVPVFSKLWGAPPISELHYGEVKGNTPFAGTSSEGLIFLSEVIFKPAYAYIIAQVNHELGHLWWGTMASAVAAEEAGFFNESLAEYSLWRGRGELQGEAARDTGSRMNAVWYMYRRPSSADAPVLSKLGSETAIFAIYHKGSTTVRALEELVGVDALDAGLSSVIKAGWSAALADLVKELQAKSGVDLGPFVEKWLKGTGYPTLKVTSAVTAAASGWEVVLGLTGDDFPMSLPLRLRHSDGTVEKQVLSYQDGRGKAQLQTTARPAVIELDPGWTAVREVRPAVEGDVSLDGQVDGADLIEVALRLGGYLPSTRRVDGKYDPLHDVDGDRALADADLDRVVTLAAK